MKYLLYITIALASCVALLTGCTSSAPADDIDTAEQALARHEYTEARSICETVEADSTSLEVADLCRLSIIYMKLSDIEDSDLNTAAATQCFQKAMALDADSAAHFYDRLPIDEARHVEIMYQLNRILNGSHDIYIDEDSIFIDSMTPDHE